MAHSLAPQIIGLDWGTSTLRAYLLADGGAIVESAARPWGIQHVPDGNFAKMLSDTIGGWQIRHAGLPIIASGMIGSRGGWREVPYASCPVDPATLAAGLLTVESINGCVHLVPGVIQRGTIPNVMRGEETQILGALAREPQLADHSLAVLPGTHSKWVLVRNGLIESFSTHMTGELFAILREHSILGRPARETSLQKSDEVFLRGLSAARDAKDEGISARLFSTRSLFLTGELPAEHTLEYLSGLLIGEEIRSALATQDTASLPPIVLIGDGALCSRYQMCLTEFGARQVRLLEDTAPHGLWLIARAHGLV
ncbi:MAG: 2-dehydro-3-deoxygalactonokinase [Verrucomicrobia bacterium]|nr:2-dehydro-3-deoxygalactonokinase [Verrucomicrobiota bacterium]